MSERGADISSALLDSPVSYMHLAEIAREYLQSWEELAPRLELTPVQEEEIRNTYGKYGDQKREALRLWRRIKGSTATYRALIAAAVAISNEQLADDIRSLLRASGGQPTLPLTQPPSLQVCTTRPPSCDNDRVEAVKAAIAHLEKRFSDVMSDTRSAMCDRESLQPKFLDKFRDVLLLLPVAKKAIHVKFFRESEDEILDARNMQKLFAILSRYWSYTNYEILLHLVNRFCDIALKKSMREYCNMLDNFEVATTIDVYIDAISASDVLSLALSQMVLKINKPPSVCTLHEIRKLKEALAERASLCSYSMYIESVAPSSVMLVLRFPPSAMDWVLAALGPDFLRTHFLVEVTVDGQPLTASHTPHTPALPLTQPPQPTLPVIPQPGGLLRVSTPAERLLSKPQCTQCGGVDLACECCETAKSASHQSQSVPSSVVPTYVVPNTQSFAQAPSSPWPGYVTRSPAPPYLVPMSYATPGNTPSYPPPPTPCPYASTWFHGNTPYPPASIPMATNPVSLAQKPSISPSALVSYQKQIRYDYRTSNPVMALEWPPPPTLKYISLAMIKQNNPDRGEITDRFIRMTIHGDADNILHDKVPVKVEQLFSLDTSERKVILVEGAPGSGKSTLLWHICQKWQSGELFQQFTLVLLVLLRDTAVHNAKCLADILPYLPDDCSQSSKLRDSIATQIRASYGEGVLIMLDGWDEAPHSLQQEGSLIHNIITAPSKCALQKAAIVVSSRPKASACLWLYASTRVEVIGFTKERRNEYIQENIENLASAEKLMQQIEAIPQLGQNCHLPLNLAIITNTFVCSKNELPSTYCRTIIALALNCLLRHFKKIGCQSNEYKSIEVLKSFSDVPDSLKEQFVTLCRIAYGGVVSQKYSFSKQFLSDQARASCEVETFGLLQAVHSLVSSGSSTVYHFLHLSLQELCAAYYITSLPDTEEQIMKLRNLKTITSIVDTEIGMSQVKVERKFERRNPRFDPVCQFYAALTQLSNSRVLAALMDEYPPLNDNFTGYECVSMSREHFLDNLPHCVNDSPTDRPRMCKVSHGFLHCLYEAQNPSLVKELGVTALKVTGDTSPPSLALAYLISIATGLKKFTYSKSSGIFSRQVFLEALVADALSKSTVEEVICEEVSFSCTDSHPKSLSIMLKNRKLKKLEMHECFGDQLFPFSALLNGSIEDLTVSSSNIDASIMLPVLEKLLLKRLNISCCGIGYTSMEAISTIPIICTTLKQFNISGNNISDGVDYLAKALVQTSLEELDISDCQIRNDGIIAIASALKATQTLISIDVHGNSFGTEGILAIAEALNHTSLQKLDIRYCDLTGEKGLLAIASALRSNTTLNCLAISESEGVDMELIRTSIVQSLMENPRFISVYVENHLLLTDELQAKLLTKDILSIHMIYFPSTIHFNLTTSSPLKEAFCSGNLKMIVDILGLQKPPVRTDKLVIHFRYGENETIIDFSQKMFIKLSLQHCQLCAKSLQYLSTTPYCHHLKYLDISGNHIGHSEAVLVATFLQRNPVEFLSISDCSIDSVGLKTICLAIKTNPTLKSLNISKNKMSDVKLPSSLTTILIQTSLKELDMSHCDLREEALAEVCTALSTSTTLTHLRLGGNDFVMSKHATSKLILILTSTPLEVIDIHGCSIAEDSMDEVYSTLSTSTTITSISLPNSCIGSSATSHLGDLDDLVEGSSLYKLDTRTCDNGLEAIFEALRRNKSLTDLRLRVNRISHIAASRLTTLLECSSLHEIDIGNCSKEGSSMEQFVEVLIHNSALTHLTLRGYSISHGCAIILAELLEQSSLHKLDISNCDKEGSVIETLCKPLTRRLTDLTHLTLSGNYITCHAVLYLSNIMRWCLRELDIRRCDIAEGALGWLCETLAYNVNSAKIIVSSDTYRTITTVARAIEYSDDTQERMHRNSRYYQTDQLDDDAMYYSHRFYHKTDHSREFFLMLVERSVTIDDSHS